MDKKTEEFIQIRKKYSASRKQFGEVFLGKKGVTITAYEREILPIPDTVMRLARAWGAYLDALTGKMKCKK